MLRRIARSYTLEESEQTFKELKESSIWRNEAHRRIVQYLETYWLNIKEVMKSTLGKF